MILLTGAAGHIGRRMARRFLKEGIDFIGIDCADNFELPEYRFFRLDIRDPSIERLMYENGVDSVIHLAFCTKPKMDRKERDAIDLNGSRNVFECAVRNGIKHIVFASSGRVYGDTSKSGGMHDRDGNYLNPGEDEYALNKIKVEEMLLQMAQEQQLKVAILRLGIVCWDGGGVGFGDMLKAAAKTGRFVTLSGKNPSVQLVHVDDVIDGCLAAVGKEGIFDIVCEGTLTMQDLFMEAVKLGSAKPVCIKLPEKPIVLLMTILWKLGLVPIPPLYIKMFGYDITRAAAKTAAELGKPKHTIQQIIRGIVKGAGSNKQ